MLSEIERALSAFQEEAEQEKREHDEQRKRVLEASERITRETEDFLLDSGVFEAMEDQT